MVMAVTEIVGAAKSRYNDGTYFGISIDAAAVMSSIMILPVSVPMKKTVLFDGEMVPREIHRERELRGTLKLGLILIPSISRKISTTPTSPVSVV